MFHIILALLFLIKISSNSIFSAPNSSCFGAIDSREIKIVSNFKPKKMVVYCKLCSLGPNSAGKFFSNLTLKLITKM